MRQLESVTAAARVSTSIHRNVSGDACALDHTRGQTWGSLAPNQVNLTECLLSDIAENAVSFSYQQGPGGHLDGQDSGLGKFSYRAVIEEFPDLVSRVSEVSSGPLAPLYSFVSPQVGQHGQR